MKTSRISIIVIAVAALFAGLIAASANAQASSQSSDVAMAQTPELRASKPRVRKANLKVRLERATNNRLRVVGATNAKRVQIRALRAGGTTIVRKYVKVPRTHSFRLTLPKSANSAKQVSVSTRKQRISNRLTLTTRTAKVRAPKLRAAKPAAKPVDSEYSIDDSPGGIITYPAPAKPVTPKKAPTPKVALEGVTIQHAHIKVTEVPDTEYYHIHLQRQIADGWEDFDNHSFTYRESEKLVKAEIGGPGVNKYRVRLEKWSDSTVRIGEWSTVVATNPAPTRNEYWAEFKPQLEAALLKEHNKARVTGYFCAENTWRPPVPALTIAPELTTAAEVHSLDMHTNKFLGHVGSNGSTVRERIEATGWRSLALGENAYNYQTASEPIAAATFDKSAEATATSAAKKLTQGWLNSPGHCMNITDSRFIYVGFGLVHDSGYYTTNFSGFRR